VSKSVHSPDAAVLAAAALVSPRGSAEDVSLQDTQAVMDVLLRNKVPMLSLNALSPLAATTGFLERAEVGAELAEEMSLLYRLRSEWDRISREFQANGITGVFIKSVGIPPSFPYKSDNLDVLVPREQGTHGRRILGSLGYVELTNLEEPEKYLLRRFHAGEEVATIHLHTHVGWCVSFFDEAQYRDRAHPAPDDPSIMIPSLEDGALTNMAHSLYENKAVSLSDLQKLEWCWQGELNWEHMCAQADRKGWLDGLYFCVLLYDYLETGLHGRRLIPEGVHAQALSGLTGWQAAYLSEMQRRGMDMPFRVSFVFSKRMYYRKIRHNRTIGLVEKVRNTIRHTANGTRLRLGVRSQSPMLIAICGADGAGKTAHAELLRQAYDACAIRARIVWSRGGSSRFTDACLSAFRRLWGSRHADAPGGNGGSDETDVFRARRAKLRNPLFRWGWSTLVTLDLLVTYWLRVGWPLLRGMVVIADRYVADAVVELAAYMGRRVPPGTGAGRILRAFAPRPHVTYLLDLPAEIAAGRMEGTRESLEYLRRVRDMHLRFAEFTGAIVLDATRPLEELSDELVYDTLGRYFSRYGTVINALFLANPSRTGNG